MRESGVSHGLQVRRDPVPNYRLLSELRYWSRPSDNVMF
ncbi:unnamed protein product [Spirodela intermedia]|uniref:Uncharacterized protein n=1 Tax=Spirodela intermedia TaxID=51605 RepID=A0A7I8KR48_SPIIN|nr:unnamed protein product [Spirodela intermedia]